MAPLHLSQSPGLLAICAYAQNECILFTNSIPLFEHHKRKTFILKHYIDRQEFQLCAASYRHISYHRDIDTDNKLNIFRNVCASYKECLGMKLKRKRLGNLLIPVVMFDIKPWRQFRS